MLPDCSIIIPTYNAAKTIGETLNSIEFDKVWRNSIEVIVVDDGSTDNTVLIVKEYQKNNSQIYLIEKANEGVSSARNCGIKEAKGRFIFFLDADDALYRSVLDEMIDAAMTHDVDLVFADYNCYHVDDNRMINICIDIAYDSILYEDYIHNEIFRRYFTENNFGLSNVWGKLFRLDIIKQKDMKFDEKMSHGEDWLFCIQYFKVIHSLFAINSVIYEYRIDGSQNYSKYIKNLDYSLIVGHKALEKLNKNYLHFSKDSYEYVCYMREFYYQIIMYLQLDNSHKNKKKFLKEKEVHECFSFLKGIKAEKLFEFDFSRRDKLCFVLLYYGFYGPIINYFKK